MALDPVSALLDIGGKVLDRVFPDPTQQAAARLELLKLQQSGELTQIAGQMEINKVEAASSSVFVSGWRQLLAGYAVRALRCNLSSVRWPSGVLRFTVTPSSSHRWTRAL